VSAFALAAAFAWLVDMRLIREAADGGSQPYARPSAPLAPAAAATPPAAAAVSAGMAPAPAPAPAGPFPCPPGCIDMGAWAAVLGLPWHCVCLPGFMMEGLKEKAGRAVGELSAAVAGATLMVAGASWLSMLAAASSAAGTPPVVVVGPGAGGGGGDGGGAVSGAAVVREPLLAAEAGAAPTS
jgi:hypothetical protein